MTNKKVTDLTARTAAQATASDLVEIVAAGDNWRMTVAELAKAVMDFAPDGIAGWPGNMTGEYATIGQIYNNRTLTEARLYAMPHWIPRRVTIDRLAVRVGVAGGAGSVVRLGVYADSSGFPDALLVDAGTVASDSTGIKEATLSPLTIGPGRVWFSCVQQGGASACTLFGTNVYPGNWRGTSGTSMDAPFVATFRASVTGALPDPFDSTRTGNISLDHIAFRVRFA
jgi:hypothetical protein